MARTPNKYAHMVPHDIPQEVDPKSYQRASKTTEGGEIPLLKSGDPVVRAKIRGTQHVKDLRAKHADILAKKHAKKMADLAAGAQVAGTTMGNESNAAMLHEIEKLKAQVAGMAQGE